MATAPSRLWDPWDLPPDEDSPLVRGRCPIRDAAGARWGDPHPWERVTVEIVDATEASSGDRVRLKVRDYRCPRCGERTRHIIGIVKRWRPPPLF